MPWSTIEFSQIKENGRTIRYFNAKDSKLSWRGECWVVTDNGGTIIYRREGEATGVYKSNHPDYEALIEGLNEFTLDHNAERWMQFYYDEKVALVTQNQATDTKLILAVNKQEFQDQGLQYKIDLPAEFYMTDNKVTIFDFYLTNKYRTDVTYGDAVNNLPDDVGTYPEAPKLANPKWR